MKNTLKGYLIGVLSTILLLGTVRFDKVLAVRLYPEQGGELRFPQMRGGKLYYYCNNHGLFEIKI